jgi:hypothetical protein
MAQTRFCSKCGVSLVAGADRCRNCYTPVPEGNAVTSVDAAIPEGRPFVDMWLHPRETTRAILSGDPTYYVLPIAAAGGLWQAIDRLATKNAGDTLSMPVLLMVAFAIGPLGGIFGLYVGGWLVHRSGRWIGGEATATEVRASMAWGSVPAMWGGLLWIPAIALTGSALFMAEIPGTVSPVLLLIAGGLLFIQAGTGVWSFVTGLKSLSEVQGFSSWRALGNVLLAGFAVLVPVMIVAAAVLAVAAR